MGKWHGPFVVTAIKNQTVAITSNPRAATGGGATVTALPTVGKTLTFNNGVDPAEVWTFTATGLGANEILISAVDEADQAANIVTAISGNSAIITTASALSAVVTFVAAAGAAGNNIVITTNAPLTLTQFSGGSDGGTFTLTYNSVESDPISFDDNAAAVQAALEAIPALTGKITCSGGPLPGTPVSIAIDNNVTLFLFAEGSNDLTDGTGAGTTDVYIKDADISVDLLTPAVGDIVQDVLLVTVEEFDGTVTPTFEADSDSKALTSSPLNSAAGTQSTGNQNDFVFLSQGGVVSIKITGAGGTGNTHGICKAYVEIATPVYP